MILCPLTPLQFPLVTMLMLRTSLTCFKRQKSQSSIKQCCKICFAAATMCWSIFLGNTMTCCTNGNNILSGVINVCLWPYRYLSQVPHSVQMRQTSWTSTFWPYQTPPSPTLSWKMDMSSDVAILDCKGPFIPKMWVPGMLFVSPHWSHKCSDAMSTHVCRWMILTAPSPRSTPMFSPRTVFC